MNACATKDRQAQRIEEWQKRNQKFIGTNEPTSSSNSSLLSVNLFPAPYKINRGDEISSRLQNTLGKYDEMKDVLIHQYNQCYLVGVSQPPKHQAADQSIPAFSEKPSSSLRAPHSFRKGASFAEYDFSQVGEPCKISLESTSIQAAPKRLCGQLFDSGKMGCGSIQDTGPKASQSLERSNIRRQHSSMGVAALPTWKPTAYVRPMDGQDLVTIEVTCRGENISPGQLKPDQPESLLTRDAYSQVDNGNLTKLVRLQADKVKSPRSEIGFFNTDHVENILREMTHSWPPLLTALPTASSTQSSKLSHSQSPTKEIHLSSRHKCGNTLTKQPAWATAVDKSFLEDDLKLSSDEDEITQVLEQVLPFCSPFCHRARLQHFDESSSVEDHTGDISNAMSFDLDNNMDPLHNSSGKTSPNWVHTSQSATMPIASDASTPIYDAAEGSGGGGCAELTGLSVSGTSSESEESDSESSSNSSGERKMNHATRDNSPESEPPSSANKWQLKKWMTKVMPLEGGQGSPCMFLSDKGLCHVVPPTMPGGTLALPTTLTTSTTSCISFEQTEADVTNDHRPNVISKTQPNDTLSPQRLVGWKQPKGYRIQGAAVQSTNDEHKIQLITPTNSSLSSKFTKLQGSYKQPHTSQHFSKQSAIVDHGKERLWKKPKMDRPVSEVQMPHVNHWNVPKSVGFVDFDSSEHSLESGSDSDGEILPTKPGVTLTHNFTSNTKEEEMHIQRAMSLLSPLFPNSQLLSPIHEDTLPMVSPGRLRKAVGFHKSPTLHAWLSRTDMTDQNSSLPAHDQNVSIPKTTNDNESHWALSKNLEGHNVGARANDCNQDSTLTAAKTRDLHPEFSHTDSWPPEENLVDQLLVRWDLALISHSAEETPQKQDQEHCGNLASQELSTPVLPLVQKRKCKNVRDRQEHRKKSRWNDDTENQKISLSQPACSPSHISISDKKSNSSKLAGEKDKWRKTTSSSTFLQQKPNSKPHKAEVERRGSSTHQPLKAEPLPSRKFEAPLKRPEREQSNVQGTVSTLKDVPISNGCGRRNGSTAEVTPGKRKSFHPTEHRCATLDLSTPLQNGHRKEKRSRVMLDNMGGSLDQRLQEARKMKHKADNMVDPSWKAVTYMQAALFYIECGIVMEEDSIEAKMVYNMYCKTLEIIRHAISLQKFATSNASSNDKKLSTICYRCLSLLYLHLFCFKKDSALKYSKILMDHFKNTSLTARAQSPGKDRATTTLCSPLLDTSTSAAAGSGTLSIPQYVYHMTTSHLHITNQLLHSYDAWEQADALAKENSEFFHKLDATVGALTLTSGLRVLVQHSRTGLHWLQAEKAQT